MTYSATRVPSEYLRMKNQYLSNLHFKTIGHGFVTYHNPYFIAPFALVASNVLSSFFIRLLFLLSRFRSTLN